MTTSGQTEGICRLKSLAKGGGVILLGTVFRKILTLVFSWLLAVLLGPSGVGMFWLGMAVYSIGVMAGSLGFPQGLVKYISQETPKPGVGRSGWHGLAFFALACGLACSLAVSVLIFLFSAPLAASLLKDAGYYWVFYLVALSIPFGVLSSLFLSITQGLKDMLPTLRLTHLLDISLKTIFLLFFSFLGLKLGGALFAHLAASVVILWLSYKTVGKWLDISTARFALAAELKSFITFSLWMFSSNLVYVLVEWMSTLLVGHFLAPAEVGIFGMALRWATICGLFLGAFNPIFAPLLSESMGRKDAAGMRSLYQAETRWVIMTTAPFLIVIFLFAGQLLAVAGPEFSRGALALRIIAAGLFINSATGSASDFFIMGGWTKFTFFNSLAVCVMNIVLSLFLIPRYGIVGAALAAAITTALANIFCLSCVSLVFRVNPYDARLFKPLAAMGVSFAAGLTARAALPSYGWPVAVAGTILVYAAVIRQLGVAEEDLAVLPPWSRFIFSKTAGASQ